MKELWEKIKDFFSNTKKKSLNNKVNLKISSKDKINFLEQFSNLINSWIPITNSLKIILYQTKKKKIKIFLKNIIDLINKWVSLKNSFKKYDKIFSQFDISIIEMWEVTGKIWNSIETIKNKEEKEKELRWKIVWALIYPIVIIFLATAMVMVFMIYVIPKIQGMYKDAKVNLPDLTQAVIKTSNFLQNNIVEISVSIVILILCLAIFRKHKRTKIYFDKTILHIPIFWWLIKKKIISLFASSLWTLLSNWIIINKAIEISSKALENDYYEKEFKKVISWVSKWVELSTLLWVNEIQSWKENPYFPVELASIVKIWEQTWKLPDLLLKISKKFNKEIDSIVKNISTAIEPLVIVFVWIIVWTIIMAIMLPFFNMVNVI